MSNYSSAPRTLSRPRSGRVLGGVCAGIARRFGLEPWTVRGLFLLSCLLPGPQFLVYLALWLLLPDD
ncbi:PspC domain-containing protein [Phaeacidiphilus oryzae]|jgi:phage shock protein PspC (stress-responsive transcriptional regulator)|uniref:PspC domain-containing protein n=1 Tax=Phaeacidiphilus oryzae TaxID=348818 RepID=UPI000560F9F9|nr:PspC domain-containing protein [Phaeacidiphilus oryzae]